MGGVKSVPRVEAALPTVAKDHGDHYGALSVREADDLDR